jgi:hypothetical protein
MEQIKLTGEFQTIPIGYPCMTRMYGYVFNKIKKRWIYDKNWYRDLVKRELQK